MKIVQDSTSIESTIQGRKIEMSLESTAAAHLMSMMTRLYSDPELAIIREYATNADDSHIEAGITRPIEVSTPNSMSPFLKIRDFGVGLNADSIEEIYSRYGKSTKQHTNAQNGMLGMGCKSALAYTPQFTLVSIKDGIRTLVVIGYDEGATIKIPSMTIVSETETDEGNGTEVTIPIRRVNNIRQKAVEFFSYWPKGRVLLNGSDPSNLRESMIELGEGLYIESNSSGASGNRDSHIIVMGNVPYKVDRYDVDLSMSWDYRLIAFVPMGDVEFTPSRESLEMTSHTRAGLKAVRQRFLECVDKGMQAQVDKAKSMPEAISRLVQLRKALHTVTRCPADGYKYKGTKIPNDWQPPTGAIRLPGAPSQLSAHDKKVAYLKLEHINNTVFIYNYDRPTFTAGQKKKINLWRSTNLPAFAFVNFYFLIPGGKSDAPTDLVDSSMVVDWKDIEKLKIPTVRSATNTWKKIPGSYDALIYPADYDKTAYRHFAREIPADDIDQSEKVFWYTVSEQSANINTMFTTLAKFENKFTVVQLTSNRVNKFKRLFPKAIEAEKYLTTKRDVWLNGLTEDEKIALAIQGKWWMQDYGRLDPDRVDDPLLKKYARVARVPLTEIQKTAKLFSTTLSTLPPIPNADDCVALDESKKYRMLSQHSIGALVVKDPDHLYNYLNAVHNGTI